MIMISFREGLRAVLMSKIDVLFYGQGRQPIDNAIPFGAPLQPEPLAPTLRDPQPEGPVLQLERGIPGLAHRMVFLRGNDRWSQHEPLSLVFKVGVGGHELGRLENEVAITR